MSTKAMEQSHLERRRFFRVKDEIIFFFNECTQEEVAEGPGLRNEIVGGFSLNTALNHLTEETRGQMKIVEKNHPEIAACLKILEQKIDLVAHSVLMSDLAVSSEPAREVDISASGLAFATEHAIEAGTLLELKLILPPSLTAVVVYGKVVHCRQQDNGSDTEADFNVGVEFVGLGEQDRELLIRHVVKKQMTQIRSRNEAS